MLCLLVIECTDGAHRLLCPHAYDLEIQRAMLNNVSTLKCFSSSEGRGGLLEEL